MIIDRSIKKYIIFDEEPVHRAFEKINANHMRIIFVVDEYGVLKGIVTDGDLRRWILGQKKIDLQAPVFAAANIDFTYCLDAERPEEIDQKFSSRVEFIPLLDDRMRLKAVASQKNVIFSIGNHVVSTESPVFIIAEIGNNHNGDIVLAKKLVDKAVWAGADCVKFQMRHLDGLYSNAGDANDVSEDLGSQYVLDLLSKFQLKNNELVEVFDYCRHLGVIPLCTPWDTESVRFLEQYGVEAYKVASADLTNHDLLLQIAATGKPMICSTGMSTEREIKGAVDLLNRQGAKFVLLHCNSTYPAPFKDINLRYLQRLQKISSFPVGYSGHERGSNVTLAAVALGAKIIEKHFTLDRSMEGNDHKVSLLPEEFYTMVQGIRETEAALGTGDGRIVSQGELINRESLAKSLIINQDLKKGEIITGGMLEIKSPGKGLPPYKKNELIGKKACRNLLTGDFLYDQDLLDNVVTPRRYQFVHPYGVPARYHDLQTIAACCPMDLLEIHLSYKDLDVDLQQFFVEPLPHNLIVHSPELFSGDHILDLCSSDDGYRNRSIDELQRVIMVTKELKQYFPNASRPYIVVNVGGFSADHFIVPGDRQAKYDLLLDSLDKLDQFGVELIPQTMPPFPWHFGGQRFHNLFVELDEIMDFCLKNEYRVCLDVSHSKLACNHNNDSLLRFVEKIAPVTAHLHIADASGVDGEGLQVGDGEIDFKMLMRKLAEVMPEVSFIPEIWQGHKNNGQGFWAALDRLENCLQE
ncbi:MAG: CBS domain-containing protein [Candidatus Electrothrix sp. AR5]|nr:CBS domain-containing protein [Candidatus Electrothrix sp. AR5]